MSAVRKAGILKQLVALRDAGRDIDLLDLFRAQADRARNFSLELPGLLFGYSRDLISREALELLLGLAEASDLTGWRQRLFDGEAVNDTEQRAALHTLLRADPDEVPPKLATEFAEVAATRRRMSEFATALRSGKLRSVSGKIFTDVISIGIGGSHLGPELVIEALAPSAGVSPRIHFMSNLDPEHGARLLATLDPAQTLVIITSKSFTTQETLVNADNVRTWMTDALGTEAVAQQFIAVSASPQRAGEFGIAAQRVFAFQDWVGGRYSLWSAVGLPIVIALGVDVFDALLAGAARMDRHFRTAPLATNMPVLMALLGIWYVDFLDAGSRAVIPYRHGLRQLPAYLQQLEMESNGKSVQRDGAATESATAPVVWGGVGTDAQHAFFQLLHQGTPLVPVEFIAVIDADNGDRRQQDMLLANCLAQAEALMRGRSETEARSKLLGQGVSGERLELLVKHQTFPGNRPSSLLMLDKLDAGTLGMLIALYEHKIFVQACVWNINPFDQMGVELGKQLAGQVFKALDSDGAAQLSDPVTIALVRRITTRRRQ
ncbi:MAG TPA: glucose-6-phosphate isomerase [Gammaproteobacteria bacterium]|nr:glucose-6-phosphate isomerase [Gammaproteobacteria bacterium]